MQDDDIGRTPPCFAQDLIAGHPVDQATWRDVTRFRRAERERLYALRRGMAQDDRAAQTAQVLRMMDETLGEVRGRTIAAWWPIRGELDLRDWMADAHRRDAQMALPVVVEKGRPMVFRPWSPGCAMERGAWNIPVPKATGALTPDTALVPLVGVDAACFRLGNGGGYYDMTFAAMSPLPRRIGVGQGFCEMSTIFPQPWDVPMDTVLLGDGRILSASA
ncbi:5-formyltetrahydrofolate cyclo-ligase [Jannaschia rubra]|uniref:5-formyltetrahydrofolate cyclo-ligase n=1 Tax=Jannaschia rubra TaxID=282197 RepID=A0A0M6XST7_9RHOB|nr:5-formyltetrahydrofolate cyclo-ligase [Jannaschia rubra]CTQ34189.1 putative 5-formyltetrahydrofolate cyclo-ligase [Jannaschia rubra]SFG21060.1 5-formyltetrahydrofolate cyclo-ligase [Jannaschia rubra]